MGEHACPLASDRVAGHVVAGRSGQTWCVVSQPVSEHVAVSRQMSPRGSSLYWQTRPIFEHGALADGMVIGHAPVAASVGPPASAGMLAPSPAGAAGCGDATDPSATSGFCGGSMPASMLHAL